METRQQMIYWKVEQFWGGKFVDHPAVVTQGGRAERAGREHG